LLTRSAMGTEILQPQDILANERLRSVHAIYTRQSQPHHHHHHHHHQAHFSSPKSARKPYSSSPSPPPPPKQENKRRPSKPQDKVSNPDAAGSPAKSLVMGQVTILKRGESLDAKRSPEFPARRADLKKSVSLTESDLIVCGVERLGPDPELVPKRAAVLSPALLRSDGVYAGSAFSQSPSPSSLPLPRFSKKESGGGGAPAFPTAVVDDWATKDLRRLLRLD
ncbi:hypothetical protein ACLOJK_025878, partial [Asimina triloba]